MKTNFKIGCITILMLLLSIKCAMAESIRLKDGSTIVGTVLEQRENNIVVKTSFGTIIIDRSEIAKNESEQQKPAEPIPEEPSIPTISAGKLKLSLTCGYGATHSRMGVSIGVGIYAVQLYGSIGNYSNINLYGGGVKIYVGKSYSWFTAIGLAGVGYHEEVYWTWWQQNYRKEALYGPTVVLGHEFRLGNTRNLLIQVDCGATYASTKFFGTMNYSKILPEFDLAIGAKL